MTSSMVSSVILIGLRLLDTVINSTKLIKCVVATVELKIGNWAGQQDFIV
jgi:hypothetical protein